MLIDKVKEANKLIRAKEEIVNIDREYNALNRFNTLLTKVNNALMNYIKSKTILDKIEERNFSQADLTQLREKIKFVKTDIKDGIIDNSVLHELNKLIDELDTNLKFEWNKYYEEKVIPSRETIQSILDIIKNREEAEIVVTALNPVQNKWPITERRLDIINDNLNKSKRIISEIGLTKEIEEFLEKIRENRATLTDLTPEILNWLKSRDLQDKISLTFKK